jgi:hypothetical protein
MRWIKFAIGSALAIAGTVLVTVNLRTLEIRRLTAQVDALEQQRQELRDYVRRLSASRRVAQIDVIDQRPDQRGQTVSAIVWHEIERDGVLSDPQTVEVVGELMYVEAAVIKFDHDTVGKGDPEKGGSVAVFRRIFGDRQISALVPNLNQASRPAAPGEGSDEPFEVRLWNLFWQLMSDPKLAVQYGVRVAQCEAPAVRIKTGQIWEVTLDAAGGLNLRLIGERKEITLATPPPRNTRP